MSEFLHDNNDDVKAIAIPLVFSKNSLAKNAGYQHFQIFPFCLSKGLIKIGILW